MKTIKIMMYMLLSILILGVPLLFFLQKPNQEVAKNNEEFEKSVLACDKESVLLNEMTPFEWDSVYTFAPYMSKEGIEKRIGFKSNDVKETVSEGMVQLLFTKDEKIVCSICSYPMDAGYDFDFGTLTDGYAKLNRMDNTTFNIENTEGEITHFEYAK